jgi:hypothetical protein
MREQQESTGFGVESSVNVSFLKRKSLHKGGIFNAENRLSPEVTQQSRVSDDPAPHD